MTLREFASYVLFFPAFVAGPIDRLDRFTRDLRSPLPLGAAESAEAGRRLAVGLFKKFVLADALARIGADPTYRGAVLRRACGCGPCFTPMR